MLSKKHEPLWPAFISICMLILLQITVTDALTIIPKYSLAGLEFALLVGVMLSYPKGLLQSSTLRRSFSMSLIAIITFTNIASLVLVVSHLVGGDNIDGHTLILSALAIYATNIIIFGLWYWELDSPGLSGFNEPARGPDFLFPQMTAKDIHPACAKWTPKLFDYLYISVTNATAFSPTDAMPLTDRTKLLMMIQSLVSLATVALVAARAVNILN